MSNEFPKGLVAYSARGRDRKRLFCVVDSLAPDFVWVANGRLHTLERPKKKRLKHLEFIVGAQIDLPTDDETLYKRLSEIERTANRRDCSAEG